MRIALRKILAITGIGLIALGSGLWYARYLAMREVGNQVVSILSSPSSQATISHLVATLPRQGSTSAIQQALASSSLKTINVSSGSQVASSRKGTTSASASSGKAVENGRQSSTAQGVNPSQPAPAGTPSTNSSPASSSSSSTPSEPPSLQFTSRAQVVQFAIDRFTQGEILHYMSLYADRSALSPQEKSTIKEQILSHFTVQELVAMETALQEYK